MLVVSIGGSPRLRSRSGVLLERSRQWLQDRGVEVVTFQVRDFPAEDLLHARFDSPHVQHFQQLVLNLLLLIHLRHMLRLLQRHHQWLLLAKLFYELETV